MLSTFLSIDKWCASKLIITLYNTRCVEMGVYQILCNISLEIMGVQISWANKWALHKWVFVEYTFSEKLLRTYIYISSAFGTIDPSCTFHVRPKTYEVSQLICLLFDKGIYPSTMASSTFQCQTGNYFLLKFLCQEKNVPRTILDYPLFSFPTSNFFLLKQMFFQSFKTYENNIISVKVAKILWYL